MKYVMTFFWSFCLITMLNYVSGAIANVPVFDFMTGAIVSVVVSVIIILLAESFPEGEIADH